MLQTSEDAELKAEGAFASEDPGEPGKVVVAVEEGREAQTEAEFEVAFRDETRHMLVASSSVFMAS